MQRASERPPLRRWVVLATLLGCLVSTLLGGQGTAHAAHSGDGPAQPQAAMTEAERALIERYAPIVMLKQQKDPCDTDGEPYEPAPVEIVLGDAGVALRENVGGKASADPTLLHAPTADDLGVAADAAYLDFPGNPRNAGCTYARFSQERMRSLEPTTYARIALAPEEGKLALQYWFFYVFNDFNNTHESDWEMIQLVFDAASVEEALTKDPEVVGYAQHGGGELAEWDDRKLQREGSRPIVYPAAGSHGSYFGSEVYIGWGAGGTGFGCDDTSGPSRRVELTPVLMPNAPDAQGAFSWLLFQGRWGERQPWEFNGPKGPNLGRKWDDPLGAISDWRDSSLVVPASRTLGPTATDVFCTVSEGGSQLLILYGVYPRRVQLGLLVGLVLLVVLLGWAWPNVRAAAALYSAHWRTFLGIGLVTIPIGVFFNGFQLLLAELPPVAWALKWFGDTAGARLGLALTVGAFQQVAMLLVISPAVIQAFGEIRAGRSPSVRGSYRQAFRRVRVLGLALLIHIGVLGVAVLTLIGLPVAIWWAVSRQFFGQAVILDGIDEPLAALNRSAAETRRRRVRVLGVSSIYQLLGAFPGPLIGVALLVFGKTTVQFANGVSSLIYALIVPLAVLALTLTYEQGTAAPAAEPGRGVDPSESVAVPA